jgi:hypothetical protein
VAYEHFEGWGAARARNSLSVESLQRCNSVSPISGLQASSPALLAQLDSLCTALKSLRSAGRRCWRRSCAKSFSCW